MTQLFLAHADEDEAMTEKVRRSLMRSRGSYVSCWFDQNTPLEPRDLAPRWMLRGEVMGQSRMRSLGSYVSCWFDQNTPIEPRDLAPSMGVAR